jgi:hypothetical protein
MAAVIHPEVAQAQTVCSAPSLAPKARNLIKKTPAGAIQLQWMTPAAAWDQFA